MNAFCLEITSGLFYSKNYVSVTVKKKLITQKRKIMSAKKNLMTFGMSSIHIPLSDASKEDYESMKKRRASDPVFKKWIKLSYSPKKRTITVSCICKRKNEALDKFIGHANYPGKNIIAIYKAVDLHGFF
ncbi:MAG: hypothetical protein CO170_04550 [candidate division SR1 bacterium CG_4_9_14_3_um_filter_40_9]|nr:MAG: hypothetical protein CO170_04550 [candidate division SR1 bacterium CG_4_9_14_3_um_filter_40_9]